MKDKELEKDPERLVVGVRFKEVGKIYYFEPGDLEVIPGDPVIVETARGLEYGLVVVEPRWISGEEIPPQLKGIQRKATPEDAAKVQKNREDEKEALRACQKKVSEHGLPMKLIGAEYTYDRSKLVFYFTAENRVDFRDLVRDLAGIFRTRIELRQIGVRDEAKMVGGLGSCGRELCCCTFLGDFDTVSIKMAKEQNLSLNPTKISGACGRLMCCLKYENRVYESLRSRFPREGNRVRTPFGVGIVVSANLLQERLQVRYADNKRESFSLSEVERVPGDVPLEPMERGLNTGPIRSASDAGAEAGSQRTRGERRRPGPREPAKEEQEKKGPAPARRKRKRKKPEKRPPAEGPREGTGEPPGGPAESRDGETPRRSRPRRRNRKRKPREETPPQNRSRDEDH